MAVYDFSQPDNSGLANGLSLGGFVQSIVQQQQLKADRDRQFGLQKSAEERAQDAYNQEKQAREARGQLLPTLMKVGYVPGARGTTSVNLDESGNPVGSDSSPGTSPVPANPVELPVTSPAGSGAAEVAKKSLTNHGIDESPSDSTWGTIGGPLALGGAGLAAGYGAKKMLDGVRKVSGGKIPRITPPLPVTNPAAAPAPSAVEAPSARPTAVERPFGHAENPVRMPQADAAAAIKEAKIGALRMNAGSPEVAQVAETIAKAAPAEQAGIIDSIVAKVPEAARASLRSRLLVAARSGPAAVELIAATLVGLAGDVAGHYIDKGLTGNPAYEKASLAVGQKALPVANAWNATANAIDTGIKNYVTPIAQPVFEAVPSQWTAGPRLDAALSGHAADEAQAAYDQRIKDIAVQKPGYFAGRGQGRGPTPASVLPVQSPQPGAAATSAQVPASAPFPEQPPVAGATGTAALAPAGNALPSVSVAPTVRLPTPIQTADTFSRVMPFDEISPEGQTAILTLAAKGNMSAQDVEAAMNTGSKMLSGGRYMPLDAQIMAASMAAGRPPKMASDGRSVDMPATIQSWSERMGALQDVKSQMDLLETQLKWAKATGQGVAPKDVQAGLNAVAKRAAPLKVAAARYEEVINKLDNPKLSDAQKYDAVESLYNDAKEIFGEATANKLRQGANVHWNPKGIIDKGTGNVFQKMTMSELRQVLMDQGKSITNTLGSLGRASAETAAQFPNPGGGIIDAIAP